METAISWFFLRTHNTTVVCLFFCRETKTRGSMSRGMVGKIYVGDPYALLHANYRSRKPHGLREEFLPIVS